MLTAIDLFSGAGGLSAGLVKAGFRIASAVDIWESAVRTYRLNFEHPIIQADIRNVSEEEMEGYVGRHKVDLIAGGPPCQGFSSQTVGTQREDNADCIFQFARFVRYFQPRMFLMEYAPGLLGKKGGSIVEDFMDTLKSFGYTVCYQKINALEFGVPQTRNRVYFYGWLGGPSDFYLSPPDHTPDGSYTVSQAIGDLPAPSEKQMASDPLHYRMRTSELNLKRLRHVPPGGGVEDIPDDLIPPYRKFGGRLMKQHGVYGRLHPDRPAGPIIAGFDSFTRGRFAHPHEDRNITLREGARLQTFPDDFLFEGSQRDISALIGNSTPPLLAQIIGRAIAAFLRGEVNGRSLKHPLFSTPPAQENLKVWRTSLRHNISLFPSPCDSLRHLLQCDGKDEGEVLYDLPSANETKGASVNSLPKRQKYHDLIQLYQSVGLLYEEEGEGGVMRVRVTKLGRTVLRWLGTLNEYNLQVIGSHLAAALAACQLNNPTQEGRKYRDSVEVFPFAFIWRAMLSLGGRISADELNRVIFRVTDEDSLDDAIRRIATARENNDPSILGRRVEKDDGRIIQWMSMASFGWILLRQERDPEGSVFFEVRGKASESLKAALSVRYKHRQYNTADRPEVKEYVEHIARSAELPEDIR